MADDGEQDHIAAQSCHCLESVHNSSVKAFYKNRTAVGKADGIGRYAAKPAVCQTKRQGSQEDSAVIDDIELYERYGTIQYVKVYITA